MKFFTILSIVCFHSAYANRTDSDVSFESRENQDLKRNVSPFVLSLIADNTWNGYRGLIFEKGVVQPRPYKMFTFAEGYAPTTISSMATDETETKYSFSEERQQLQVHGVNAASLKMAIPIAEGQAELRSRTRQNGKVRTFITSRKVYSKYVVSTDPTQLIIESDIAEALKGAVSGRGDPLNKCIRLIRVLNDCGWYIALNYTLGGALYSTQVTEVRNVSDANKQSSRFGATLWTNESLPNGQRRAQLNCIGCIGGVYSDDTVAFTTSLEDPKKWRIVRYESFLPTLMLLKGFDYPTLNACLRLLVDYGTYPEIVSLQPNINIREYEYDLVYRLSPRY